MNASIPPGRRPGERGILLGLIRRACTIALVFVAMVVDSASAYFEALQRRILDASGDPISGAVLSGPFDVATDAAGNAYVSGYLSHNVFKVTQSNVVTKIIDGSGAGLGSPLLNPWGVATDAFGNVFVVGEGSDNAFKIASNGSISRIINAAGDRDGNGLDAPRSVAVDSSGNAYVSGRASNNVFKISPDGRVTLVIDSSGAGPGRELVFPEEVLVDQSDNVYVVGNFSSNVIKRAPDGAISQVIGPNGDGFGHKLLEPQMLAVGPDGDLYVSGRDPGTFGYEVFAVRANGVVELVIPPLAFPESNRDITALATDSLGRLLVARQDVIRAYESDGTGGAGVMVAIVGNGDGHPALSFRGMAVDSSDRVYTVAFYSSEAYRAPSPVPEPAPIFGLVTAVPVLAAWARPRRRSSLPAARDWKETRGTSPGRAAPIR